MTIRRMKKKDIPEVAFIESQCFTQPWSEHGFEEAMNDAVFLIAEENERIAGYIGMYVMEPIIIFFSFILLLWYYSMAMHWDFHRNRCCSKSE